MNIVEPTLLMETPGQGQIYCEGMIKQKFSADARPSLATNARLFASSPFANYRRFFKGIKIDFINRSKIFLNLLSLSHNHNYLLRMSLHSQTPQKRSMSKTYEITTLICGIYLRHNIFFNPSINLYFPEPMSCWCQQLSG